MFSSWIAEQRSEGHPATLQQGPDRDQGGDPDLEEVRRDRRLRRLQEQHPRLRRWQHVRQEIFQAG